MGGKTCTGEFDWPIPDRGLSCCIHCVTAPWLIVRGKHDRLVLPIYAHELAGRLHNSRVKLIDRASHVLHLEQRQQVSRPVIEFLRKQQRLLARFADELRRGPRVLQGPQPLDPPSETTYETARRWGCPNDRRTDSAD